MITYLYLNRACNNACVFCASSRTVLKMGPREVSLAQAKAGLNKASSATGGSYLLISGGEPTIHRYLVSIVKHASNLFDRVALASNGIRLADSQFARDLCRAGVNTLGVPFYADNKQLHNALTRNESAFELSRQGVLNAASAGVQINIKTFVAGFTYRSLSQIFSWAIREFGPTIHFTLDSMRYSPAVASSSDNFSQCTFTWQEARQHVVKAVNQMLASGVRILIERIPLCVFPAETIVELYNKGAVGHKRQKTFRILPGGKTDFLSPEEFEPAVTPHCQRCDLESICCKCYDNAADPTKFQGFLRPFILSSP